MSHGVNGGTNEAPLHSEVLRRDSTHTHIECTRLSSLNTEKDNFLKTVLCAFRQGVGALRRGYLKVGNRVHRLPDVEAPLRL